MMKIATVLYRLPGEVIPYELSGPELPKKPEGAGFCFVPYDSGSTPVYIAGEAKLLSGPPGQELFFPDEILSAVGDGNSDKAHSELVAKAVEFIRKGGAEKVVLARKFMLHTGNRINVAGLLDALSHAYPNAMVYCFKSSSSGTWIGATPEVLLRTKGRRGETVALAGTRKKAELWTEKEYEEQAMVTKYIMDILQNHVVSYADSSGPVDLKFGYLRHLKTEITFESQQHESILKDLFPTPATCGRPKLAAQKFIADFELASREYYSGYLGPIHENGDMNLFVNLRCMKLFRDGAVMFAGSGITAKSNPQAETLEVNLKAKSIMAFLEDANTL